MNNPIISTSLDRNFIYITVSINQELLKSNFHVKCFYINS